MVDNWCRAVQQVTESAVHLRGDFLFCLFLLEARGSSVLHLYGDLLDVLLRLRTECGVGWLQEAQASRVGDQAAAALQWIVRACASDLRVPRVHLSPLTGSGATALGSTLLFPVASGPPARERLFQTLKQRHGSSYAFHGSHPSKWASILRYGLKSLSNTDLMTHGKALGAGLYLSQCPYIAAIYSHLFAPSAQEGAAGGGGGGGARSQPEDYLHDPKSMRVLALCEVVEAPGLRRPSRDLWPPGLVAFDRCRACVNDNTVWVTETDGSVAVRLLLVFPEQGFRQLPHADELAAVLPGWLESEAEEQVQRAAENTAPSAVQFPVTSVRVPRAEKRDASGGERSQCVFYCVMASIGDSACTGCVWRRYSDFESLRERVGSGPRAPFPQKLGVRSVIGLSEALVEKRRAALESWLSEVVQATRRGLVRGELQPEICAFLGTWGS